MLNPEVDEAEELRRLEQIQDIEDYCYKNRIKVCNNSSYYFSINGMDYRVSDHRLATRPSSVKERFGNDKFYSIIADPLKIVEIHSALKKGKKIDVRGRLISWQKYRKKV